MAYWNFRKILSHHGPLASDDPMHKGSLYNVFIEWETGEVTMEPLKDVKHDKVVCGTYARKNGLLDMPGLVAFSCYIPARFRGSETFRRGITRNSGKFRRVPASTHLYCGTETYARIDVRRFLRPFSTRYKFRHFYGKSPECTSRATRFRPARNSAEFRPENATKMPGWKQFRKHAHREQKLLRLVNQAKLHSFRTAPVYKHGHLVPRTHEQAMELDTANNNTQVG